MTTERNEKNGTDDIAASPAVSDSFAAACFCALLVPSALWAYDGRVVLGATAATFVAVYLFGCAVGLTAAVIRGLRNRPKTDGKPPRVEYVTRHPFEADRRLGYVSADTVCRAAKEGRQKK